VTDDSFLVLFNAHSGPIDWSLPKQWGKRWEAVFDTSVRERGGESFDGGQTISMAGHSLVVFQRGDGRE
jgi:glycogen operon protein